MAWQVKYEGGEPIRLTWEEIIASLALGGWPEKEWITGAAVIDAESGRAINIYNTYLQGHYGLMQIGKQQHPEFFKDADAWMTPWENTKMGYNIFAVKKQGWNAWEAYSNKRYVAGLVQATAAYNSVVAKRKKSGKSGVDFYQTVFRKDMMDALIILGSGISGKDLADSIAGGAEGAAGAIDEAGTAIVDTMAEMQSTGIFSIANAVIGAGRWLADSSNWLRIVQVAAGGALLIGGIGIVAKPLVGVTPAGMAAKAGRSAVGAVKQRRAAGRAAREQAAAEGGDDE
ncbi:transglycosylase SLT domain-containing protein [Streptomyces sp. NPDC056264]|uniref:transglycosylase SLT domain-containing protein n=1 Tax=Streptomyces sp. NPDC056264 TaxID=3345767 RepID=UPI003AAF1698